MTTIRELFDLSDRVAIVTGGGTHLGRAMATALGELGAAVYIASRRVELCEQVASELRDAGIDCVGLGCDVTVESQVEALGQTGNGRPRSPRRYGLQRGRQRHDDVHPRRGRRRIQDDAGDERHQHIHMRPGRGARDDPSALRRDHHPQLDPRFSEQRQAFLRRLRIQQVGAAVPGSQRRRHQPDEIAGHGARRAWDHGELPKPRSDTEGKHAPNHGRARP